MNRRFATTRWSLVLGVQGDTSTQARKALAQLCESYWYPLYAFVRRQGYDADEARDLTQAYFAKLLEKDYIKDARPEAGRFRTFLLTSLKHFLYNEWDRSHTIKRGGRIEHLPLEVEWAEDRYTLEPADRSTPETLYERKWAMTALDRSLARLKAQYESTGRGREFEVLSEFLTGSSAQGSYRAVARSLGKSESAIRVAVHRLRKRFGQCLREELATTLRDLDEVDGEIRHLLEIADQWEPAGVSLEVVDSPGV